MIDTLCQEWPGVAQKACQTPVNFLTNQIFQSRFACPDSNCIPKVAMVTASLRLYRSIKQDIISCDLRPGSLFSEGEMCRRYKASRTPVREACRRLEKEGLIKIIPFRGYFVAPLTVGEFHSLQEIQLIIDTACAAWAAKRASPEQVRAIERMANYEYHLGVPTSYSTFLQRNLDFHVGIARATGNEHLAEIANDVHTRLMRFYYLVISMDKYGPELVQEHRHVVGAIRAGNPGEARKKMAEHVINGIRRSANLFIASSEARLADGISNHEAFVESRLKSAMTWDMKIEHGDVRKKNKR